VEVLNYPGDSMSGPGSVVTIGAYDGVHVGHRLVINRVRRAAADQGLASVVVTFDRHPASVVRPQSAPPLLTDLEQKLELLASTGIDCALVIRFDRERSEEPAEDFVREVLVGCLDTRAVVVGHGFHFGHARGGNVALLQAMGAELGFDVTAVRLHSLGPTGEPVSSTRIRELLAAGKVDEAAALLGRPHQLRGRLAPAADTASSLRVLVPAGMAVPAPGTYAGWWGPGAGGAREPAAVAVGAGSVPAGSVPAVAVPAGAGATGWVLELHRLGEADHLGGAQWELAGGSAAQVEFVSRLPAGAEEAELESLRAAAAEALGVRQ
jgi:riboflavin kinase/FMN adenylyltransferase